MSIKNLWAGQTYNSVFKYDNANQTKSITHKITQTGAKIASNTYVYDTAGNRIRDIQVDAAGASRTLNYVYNKLYELTSVTGAQAHSYAYDKVGNRTTADGVTYTTNNVNQYTNVGGTGLTYDNNGNLLTEGPVTYTYDAENRLRSVQNSNTYSFKYDALNRRVSKAMNGSVLQYFVNDGDQLIEEYSGANALVADYTHGTGIDEVLTMTKGGETYYYVYDALGNVKSYLTAGGVSSGIIEYDPFGKPMPVTIGNPILFTGRYYDIETGLYYYRARYYNPTLGRFLQRDPIGYFDSMNLYGYVSNNPINLIDPFGLEGIGSWIGGFGTSFSLTLEWGLGWGLSTRHFGPNSSATQNLMNAPGVNQARDNFYRFNKNSCNLKSWEEWYDFNTLEKLIAAGFDPTEQMLGSFFVRIIPINGGSELQFQVYNRTSFNSLTYHQGPSWNRSQFGPGGNMDQWYSWTEKSNL